jgi:bifunctional non-homologous end joining protein LigD
VYRASRSRTWWYRLRHGDDEIDWLTIGEVTRLLAEAGVDLADLVDVIDGPSPDGGRRGVA